MPCVTGLSPAIQWYPIVQQFSPTKGKTGNCTGMEQLPSGPVPWKEEERQYPDWRQAAIVLGDSGEFVNVDVKVIFCVLCACGMKNRCLSVAFPFCSVEKNEHLVHHTNSLFSSDGQQCA